MDDKSLRLTFRGPRTGMHFLLVERAQNVH